MTDIINCTPHDIVIFNGGQRVVLPASGIVARLKAKSSRIGERYVIRKARLLVIVVYAAFKMEGVSGKFVRGSFFRKYSTPLNAM